MANYYLNSNGSITETKKQNTGKNYYLQSDGSIRLKEEDERKKVIERLSKASEERQAKREEQDAIVRKTQEEREQRLKAQREASEQAIGERKTSSQEQTENYRQQVVERAEQNANNVLPTASEGKTDAVMDSNGNIYDLKKLGVTELRELGDITSGTAEYINGKLENFKENNYSTDVKKMPSSEDKKDFIKSGIIKAGSLLLNKKYEDVGNIAENLFLGTKKGSMNFIESGVSAVDRTFDDRNKMVDQMLIRTNKTRGEKGFEPLPTAEESKKIILGDSYNKDLFGRDKEEQQKKWENKKSEIDTKITTNIEDTDSVVGKKLAELAPSIGQQLPGYVLPSGLGLTYFTGSAKGAYMEDAKARGMSEEDANAYSGIMALGEGFTEMIGAKITKGIGKNIAKGNPKNALKLFGLDIFENAVEEAIMEPISEATATITGGKETADWSNMGKRMLNSGINGGLSAVIMAGTSAGIGKAVQLTNKMNNGEQVSTQEVAEAVKETLESNKVNQEDLKEIIKENTNEIIKQEMSEIQEQGMTQEQNMIPMETATNEGSYTKQQELLNNIENNQETLYNNNESESGINETILKGRTRGNGRIEGEIADQTGKTSNTGISTENVSQNFKENRQISYEEFIDYANKNTIQQDTDETINIKQKAKELGLNAILFNGDGTKDYYGMTDKSNPNNIYIDINQKEIRGEDILYHEFLHSRKRNNDSIYADKISPIEQDLAENYSDVINNFIDEKGLDERYKKYPELISEEIIADYTSKHLGSLEIDYDLPLIYEETINQAVDEMIKNVRNSNAQSQNAAPSMENNVQKYNKYKQNIIKSKETQVNNLINFKNETSRNIDQKIAEKEALLNSKKNQNTKTSSILKSQIENLKAQKQSIENLYNEKIDKTNSKISKEKIEFETRNRIKKEAREVIRAEIAPLTEDLTKYKDKKAGLLFNRETAQRNIDDIVSDKELANSVKEIIFNPVQKHQANKTREINTIFEKINSLELDKKKKYYYIPKESKTGLKVDEATLAQLLIEKKITDEDLLKYDIDNKGIEKIHNTADTFKEILDDLYVRMNEQQLKYGYSPIGKIENYFPHFTENKADTMLGKIASYFNIDLSNQSLPTDIAGLTDTFKPGETWNANIQKRRTEKTDYDALTAMERYVLGATEIIHTTEDIQRVREYAKQIRYKYSDKAIQEEIDKIINNNELTQEAKDSSLEGIFKNAENGLPNFVTWLDDYANTLAGKKAFADRNMERNIGRNMYKSMSGIESRIASNTIGGNVSVSLTNFAPLFQAMGTTKVNYLLTGMLQTTKNNITGIFDGGKDTSFANNSTFLTNRFGTDSISRKTFSQKFSDKASALMNMIDEFTAESIVRGKYLEKLDSGMTEEQALKSADEYAGKIMADRSKGALPLIFNAKNPLSKLMTMFQVEPNNIVSNYFKDMPRDAKSDAQFTKQITKLMVASYAFNSLVMAIRGGNEVLPDPIRWVSYLIQMVTGDDDEKEKAKDDLIESLVGSIPFISNLAGFVGMEDIGRVPISNAMPDLTKISSLFDPEVDSKYKKETALKEFSKPFLYLGLPTGGAQLKKFAEGIATVSAGGSYKTNKKGETQLQFPVENANVLDYAKAGVFGKYSLSDSKAYADRGYKALSGKQTKTYKESRIPFKEYTEYIDSKLKKNEDKINYINNTKWNTDQKWGIYKNDILSDNERKDGGSQVSDAEYIVKNGTSKLDYINSYNKLQKNNLDIPTKEEYIEMKEKGVSLKGYTDYKTKVKQETESKRKSGELTQEQELKDKDKLEILINSNYSQKETQGIYESYILRSTDKKYDIVKTSFTTENKLNINKYLQYKLAEANGEFDADRKDDGTENGKAVYGSSKKKRWTYIENMDITYTQKLILYGLECTPTNSEQTQIVNYINSLPNKTQKEKLEILDQFEGFTIYKNGTFKY